MCKPLQRSSKKHGKIGLMNGFGRAKTDKPKRKQLRGPVVFFPGVMGRFDYPEIT